MIKKSNEKLSNKQKKFLGTCNICGKPMKYLGGNILSCTDNNCHGYRILDKRSEQCAQKMFSI